MLKTLELFYDFFLKKFFLFAFIKRLRGPRLKLDFVCVAVEFKKIDEN